MSLAELFYRKNQRPSRWSRLRRRPKPSLVTGHRSLVTGYSSSPIQRSAFSVLPAEASVQAGPRSAFRPQSSVPRLSHASRFTRDASRFLFEPLESRLLLSAAPSGAVIPETVFTEGAEPVVIASHEGTGTDTVLAPLVDTARPGITARLLNDTGFSATDGLTNNPTTTGSVQAASGIISFRAGFDATPEAAFVNILTDLSANGVFLLSATRLAQINGGALTDGFHTLHLRLTDSEENTGVLALSFTLDTTPPNAPTLDLLSSSDSGLSGNDNVTNDLTPTLAFTADPTAQIVLFHDFVLVATLPPGTFVATIDAPGPGTFSYNAFTKDAAGNFSDSSVPLVITFDPIAPEMPGFELVPASIVGPAAVSRAMATADSMPLAIPDNGTLRSTTTVAGVAGTLFDVNVAMALSHEALPDLTATLISPTGTRVALFLGLPGEGLTDTVFDDSGPTGIASGLNPYTGRFLPKEPLALFNGENPNGMWTLEVADEVDSNGGTLVSWSLVLRATTGLPTVAGVSSVTFSGWTDPSVTVKLIETGAMTTSALDGSFSFSGVNLPPSPSQWTVVATDRAGNENTFHRDILLGQNQAFLHGTVFHDRDGGGSRSSGEPALPGWTIYLDLDHDQTLDLGEPSTVTDGSGRYAFTVTPGAYTITEVPQTGWEQTAPAGTVFDLVVAEGDIRSGLDFGNLQLGHMTGTAFHDFDADGFQDPGEPSLSGWTIYLDANDNGSQDAGERATVTDALGAYRLDDLRPGTYVVREEVPTGWRQTTPSSGGYSLALAGGQVVTDRNFGAVQLGSLRGEQFEDVDGNGTRDVGEPGLAGWTLYLDANGNGRRDAGEPTTMTDADGAYAFFDLLPGSYRVAEEIPTGWTQTFPRLQPPGPTVGPAGLSLVHTDAVEAPLLLPDEILSSGSELSLEAVGPADNLTRLDAVLADPRFADLDGHGMTIAVIDTGIDIDHPFFGPDLNGDRIADRIVAQIDFANGDADASDHSGHGSHIASLIGSQDATNRGVAPAVDLIALKVFEDSGTGQFSYLEQALQWVVANAATYGIDVVNMSLGDGGNWTDAIGRYGLGDELAAIANLGILEIAAAGNSFFSVGSVQGVAYPAADPNVIAAGAVWSADFGGPFTFGSGAKDITTGPDRIASFSQRHETLLDVFAPGARFTGANQNGGTTTLQGTSQASAYLSGIAVLAQELAQRELGRSLAPSEFVDLVRTTGQAIVDGDDENDNVTNTGLTFPRVDALALMNAVLAVTGPGPEPGTGGGGGQPAGGALVAHSLILSPGQHLVDLDFGNFHLGELYGVAFQDANVDGLRNVGEQALAGWTVYLDDNRNGIKDPGERSTTTDDAGTYRFADLGPSRYVLQEEAPARWGRTANAAGSPEIAMTSGASVNADFGNVRITLDVDGDGAVTVFGDGRLIARYLAGASDAQLMAGSVIGPNAVRADATVVRTYLSLAQGLSPSMLDADGNGTVQSVTDGKLILRYLAGLPDTQLMAGEVVGSNATLTSAAMIRSFLDSFRSLAPQSAKEGLSRQPSAANSQSSTLVAESSVTGAQLSISAANPEPLTLGLSPTGRGDGEGATTASSLTGRSDGSVITRHSPPVTIPMGLGGLTIQTAWLNDDTETTPLTTGARPWVAEFVLSSAVTEDPNRDLMVTV